MNLLSLSDQICASNSPIRLYLFDRARGCPLSEIDATSGWCRLQAFLKKNLGAFACVCRKLAADNRGGPARRQFFYEGAHPVRPLLAPIVAKVTPACLPAQWPALRKMPSVRKRRASKYLKRQIIGAAATELTSKMCFLSLNISKSTAGSARPGLL